MLTPKRVLHSNSSGIVSCPVPPLTYIGDSPPTTIFVTVRRLFSKKNKKYLKSQINDHVCLPHANKTILRNLPSKMIINLPFSRRLGISGSNDPPPTRKAISRCLPRPHSGPVTGTAKVCTREEATRRGVGGGVGLELGCKNQGKNWPSYGYNPTHTIRYLENTRPKEPRVSRRGTWGFHIMLSDSYFYIHQVKRRRYHMPCCHCNSIVCTSTP